MGTSVQFVLSSALIIYSDGKNSIVTRHPINGVKQEGAVPSLGSGAAITQEFVEQLYRSAHRASGVEILSPNVLCNQPGFISWWAPACVRPLFFESTKNTDEAALLNSLSGKMFPVPAMVFAVRDRKLYAFALARSERPSKDTKMFRAPFWNIYANGNVCMGSAELPKHGGESTISEWENAFYMSAFTHANGAAVTKLKGGFAALCKRNVGKKQFSSEHLVPFDTGATLEAILNACLE